MKIAMITNNSGGLYSFRKDLILRLISDGHNVVALTPLNKRTNPDAIEKGKAQSGDHLHD